MSLPAILPYIFNHSELLIGVFLALAFLTSMFILIIPSKENKASEVDLSRIEEQLKKAIDRLPIQGATAAKSTISDEEELPTYAPLEGASAAPIAAPASGAAPEIQVELTQKSEQLETLKKEINEKDQKLKTLDAELAQVKKESSGAKPGGADPDLMVKLSDMQNKLNEYAIIEEELADISRYKEENAKLKSEIEGLKNISTMGTTAGAEAPVDLGAVVAAAEGVGAVAPAGAPDSTLQESQKIADELNLEMMRTGAISPEAEQLLAGDVVPENQEDETIRDFQAAVDSQSASDDLLRNKVATSVPLPTPAVPPTEAPIAPAETAAAESPLDGQLDTSKMILEMEKMGEASEGDESDPLAGMLDTEKLLAEVKELGAGAASSTSSASPEDDLMSEFEQEEQQLKAKA